MSSGAEGNPRRCGVKAPRYHADRTVSGFQLLGGERERGERERGEKGWGKQRKELRSQ